MGDGRRPLPGIPQRGPSRLRRTPDPMALMVLACDLTARCLSQFHDLAVDDVLPFGTHTQPLRGLGLALTAERDGHFRLRITDPEDGALLFAGRWMPGCPMYITAWDRSDWWRPLMATDA